MNPHEDMILLPLLVLALWSLLMMIWMFIGRVGAMSGQSMDPNQAKHTGDIVGRLPTKVRAVGDNYSNLFELPVLFYAVTLAVYAVGHVDWINLYLAWGFVIARILHSLIQATYNNVSHRFGMFLIASVFLIVMAARETLALI